MPNAKVMEGFVPYLLIFPVLFYLYFSVSTALLFDS